MYVLRVWSVVATLPAACKEYPAPSIAKTGDYKLHYQNQRRKHGRCIINLLISSSMRVKELNASFSLNTYDYKITIYLVLDTK